MKKHHKAYLKIRQQLSLKHVIHELSPAMLKRKGLTMEKYILLLMSQHNGTEQKLT